jgi:hypothetical protein
MRTVNDRIKALDAGAGAWTARHELFGFQCECGDTESWDARLQMTLAEYERVRSQRDRFAVLPGHETADIEHVVERSERYLIVDKVDAVERFVE